MASIIPGYEYDIFISYRQKDNKYDGWVTEFVDNLKRELEATFKEEISVYFDINPHDGLLETHDVGASLKEKLKCLVFIPVISRTYCDPKSFAWENEFLAFIKQTSDDQFGLKVKLSGGNIASRILPVQIHDLNRDDKTLIENVIGGHLRPVEFIYKEPGVNRPLKPDDDDKVNLGKTKYRNQINKTANAIDELVSGLKSEPVSFVKMKSQAEVILAKGNEEGTTVRQKKLSGSKKRKLPVWIMVLTGLLVIAALVFFPKIFKQDKLEKLMSSGKRISVAVMPFRNMTNDTTWKIWQEGIQTSIVSFLTNSGEFIVRGSVNDLIQNEGLSNYASLTPPIENIIAKKLEANVFISGSIINTGTTIRVTAQLFDTDKNEAIKSFEIEGTAKEEKIYKIIDSLRHRITDFFSVTKLKMSDPNSGSYYFDPISSPEAYKYMAAARKASDYNSAIEMYMNALKIDSNIYDAYCLIAQSYWEHSDYESCKRWTLKYYSKYDKLDMYNKIFADYFFSIIFKTPYDAIKYLNQMIVTYDQSPTNYINLGDEYWKLLQYDRAIPEYEKAFEIYKRWGRNPGVGTYSLLGSCYHKTGQYKKEKKLYRKAEQIFPGNPGLITMQAILALTEGDKIGANQYIEKYRSISKDNQLSEARILRGVALIYKEAGILNEAEKFYRQALSLGPEDRGTINSLAYFLIDKDININEGLELIERVLKSQPEGYNYLHTKGWGLYKLGKLPEAREILQKSWDLRMKNALYNHEAYLHLEAAKKVVDNQKNK